MSILDILARDAEIIPYRKELRPITGSINASILLTQMLYWWRKTKKPFYKFKEPCKHSLYKPGDSWCEELGFTKREFDWAIKSIGKKRTRSGEKGEGDFITYWTSSDRLTYYQINEQPLADALLTIYGGKNTKTQKADLPSKEQNVILLKHNMSFSKSAKCDLPITETTTETTTENKGVVPTPKKTDSPPFLSWFFAQFQEKESHRLNALIVKLSEADVAKIRKHLPRYIATTSTIGSEGKLPWRKKAEGYIRGRVFEEEIAQPKQQETTYSAPKVGLGGY